MTKEVAEKIVRGITDKIECNTVDIDDWAEFWGFTREEYEEFLDMAIKALEQTELNSSYNGVNTELDCISREAVEKITWEEPSYIDALNVLTEVREKVRALPSVTPKAEWIPVSERLPEKNVEVLATTEWGVVTIAEMYSTNDWFIHEGTTNAETDEIVAWMPLPEPYTGSEDEK